MAVYQINKGIGRSPEFKGLRSQHLFIVAGGLLAILIAFMVLYMAGVNHWICIALGVISASVLVWATFHLNAKDAFIYGGAITLELESYITGRIVLLANVRERVLWRGSLGKFSTQFGLGVKFIIN